MQLAVYAVKLVWVGLAGMAIPPISASPLPHLDRALLRIGRNTVETNMAG